MHSIVNVLGFGLAILLISGCSSTPQRIEVSAKPVERPELVLPNADRLRMRSFDWVVLTPENFDEKVAELQRTGRPVVFFALTDKGYENIALNLSDIRAYIQQQAAIIAAYENYYKQSEQALSDANAQIENTNKQIESQREQESMPPKWIPW